MRAILGCVVAFVLCLPGSAARGQAPADDLAWVPADAPGFVLFRVADLLQHDATKEMREQLFKNLKPDWEKQWAKDVGLHPREIERVILVLLPPGQEVVFLITTTRPARDNLLAAWAKDKAIRKEHKGKSYHEVPRDQGLPPWALHADDRLLVFGPAQHVLPMMERVGTKRGDGPLSEGLRLAAGKAPLVASVNLTAYAKEGKAILPPQAEAVLPLLEANPAVLTLVSDKDTELTARFTYPSDEDAANKAKALRTTIDILRQFIPIGQVELARQQPRDDTEKWVFAQGETFLRELQDACKTAKVDAQGRVVHGQLRLKTHGATLLALVGHFLPPGVLKPGR